MTTGDEQTGQEPANSSDSSQYSLQSILWITTAAAMLLAHARHLGPQAVNLLLAYVGCWLAWVAIFALTTRQRQRLLFWSALITTQAFLAVSAVKILNVHLAYGWGMVAAAAGSLASIYPGKSLLGGALINSVLSFAAMAGVMFYFREPLGLETSLDLAGAAGVGFSLVYFVRFLQWFTTQTRQPWAVVAAWLTIFVLIGNWLVGLSGY